MDVILSIDFDMCFGSLWESFYRDGSFEHPQHMTFVTR